MILDFTIFGERHSGTNYLQSVLQNNLMIPHTKLYGFKHWFIKGVQPRSRPNTTTDNECLKPIHQNAHTLFIYIVRNPFDWLAALHSRPYHIPNSGRTSFVDFLSARYIAYEKNVQLNHTSGSKTPWTIDPQTGLYFIEESDNILALRNMKTYSF